MRQIAMGKNRIACGEIPETDLGIRIIKMSDLHSKMELTLSIHPIYIGKQLIRIS
jgi:hypothetical protein